MRLLYPLLLLLLPLAAPAEDEVFLTQTPESVKVSVGTSVRLPCRAHTTGDANMTVFWNRDGFVMSLDTLPAIGQRRYRITGPLSGGIFDLEINPVELKDEGEFQCQVAVPAKSLVKLSEFARLEVTVPPKPLILIQTFPSRERNRVDLENPAWAEVGTQLRLLCIAEGGKPPPQIVWTLDSQQLEVTEQGRLKYGFRGRIFNEVEKEDGAVVVTAKSMLHLKMTNKVQNKRIRCAVKNVYPSVFVKPVYAKLQVRSKPRVRINIEGSHSTAVFKEHDTITLKCSAEGYPKKFAWRWMIIRRGSEKAIPEVRTSWYRLQLRRELHGAILRCVATNFAPGSAEWRLDIQYGPAIRDTSSFTHAATLGDSAQLRCDVDSNPKAEVTWTRASFPAAIGRGPLLLLPSVDSSDLGAYTCVAQVPGFAPARKTFFLGLAGKPKIESRNPVYGKTGKSIKLVCSIHAIPKPSRHSIRWSKRGQALIRGDRHHIYQQDFLEGIRSVIFISHIEDSDFGDYNCSAGNALGTSWSLITLKKEDDIPLALAAGLAAAGLLVLVSFLLLILFLVRRARRQKARKAKHGYLPGEARQSDGPPSVYGCGQGSTSNDFSNKEASWLRGETRHSYFHVPSELGEMQTPGHPLALDASREATLRRIMEWRDDGSPLHPASPHASTTRGSPMHSSIHQATHQFITDRGSTAVQVQQQPSNSDSGISNDNFCTPTSNVLPSLARNHSPITFSSPNHPVSPVRSNGSNRSASIIPSPPLPLFSGPRRHYLPPSLGDSSDDTRL